MDAFCLYLFLIGCIEFLYFLIVGDFPRNALISGLFAPFGTMIITSNLYIFKKLLSYIIK